MPGDGWPAVSPDGRKIAVARAWGKQDSFQNLRTGLYVTNADGSGPRLIVALGYNADVGGASWSPDGRRLVFSVHNNGPGRPKDASALFSVTLATRSVSRITAWVDPGLVSSPTYAPNGHLILFQLKPPHHDFGGQYYTVHADGSAQRRLTSFPANSTLGAASWSPDGRSLTFANTGTAGQDDIFIMRADGTHITRVTRTAAWESAPARASDKQCRTSVAHRSINTAPITVPRLDGLALTL